MRWFELHPLPRHATLVRLKSLTPKLSFSYRPYLLLHYRAIQLNILGADAELQYAASIHCQLEITLWMRRRYYTPAMMDIVLLDVMTVSDGIPFTIFRHSSYTLNGPAI